MSQRSLFDGAAPPGGDGAPETTPPDAGRGGAVETEGGGAAKTSPPPGQEGLGVVDNSTAPPDASEADPSPWLRRPGGCPSPPGRGDVGPTRVALGGVERLAEEQGGAAESKSPSWTGALPAGGVVAGASAPSDQTAPPRPDSARDGAGWETDRPAPPTTTPVPSCPGGGLPDDRSAYASATPPPKPGRGGADVEPFEYWATPVEPGRTLVEASAGTGKTFAIAGLVLRLVLEGEWLGAAPDLRRLLVVTFTNAATDELRTRVRAALRTALAVARGATEPDDLTRPLAGLLARDDAEGRLLAALDRVDEAGIFTIHGFCRRVLEQAAFESGTPFDLDFVEDADSAALRARAAADAWARLTHADPLLTALALHHGRTPETLVAHHADTADFPHVRVLPEAPGLDDALGALHAARSALADAWDADTVGALLADLDWNKDAPLDGRGGAEVLGRVAAFAGGADPDGLGAVALCTAEAVRKKATTRSKAQKEAVAEVLGHPALAACEAVMEAARAVDLAFVRTFVREVDEQITAIKERRGQLTFGDLITRLHDALHDDATGPVLAETVRRQFAVALVDEFQDTDPLQYAIFKTAFEGRPLYFVGDPKQAIYAFRGADVHAYLRAQRDADRRFTLGTNWRSAGDLVDAVNAVFARPERAFLFDDIPFRPVQAARREPALQDGATPGGDGGATPPLVWWPTPTTADGRPLGKGAVQEAIPTYVAAEVRRLLAEARLGDRALEPGDIAVLVPTRFVAGDVQAALRDVGVPAVVSRANDVRDSDAMADVELVLRAVLRAGDERALRAALSTELWGWTAREVADLDEDPGTETAIAGRLREWQRGWRRGGVLGVLVAFQEAEGVLERLLARPDGERWATDLRHTAELLHEIERAGARSPDDLLHWLRHRADQALPSRGMKELRLERDAAAVTITTHHNAKGLEYEVVFLPYLWSVSERDYKRQDPVLARTPGGVVYDLRPEGTPEADEHDRLRQADALAERVRTAYVALTRARERCYVVWGPVTSWRTRIDNVSALGYLLCGHGAERGDGLADHVEAARKQALLDDVLAPVHDLDASGRLMTVLDPPSLDDTAPPAPTPAPQGGAALALPDDARRRVGSPWRRASFTAWTSERGGDLAASDEPVAPEARTDAEPTGLHAFAAGAGPGTCLHEILQYAKWGDDEDAAETNRETVRRRLERHGLFRPARHRARIDPEAEALALVERVATAPLLGGVADTGGVALREVLAESLAPEWDFTLPLARVAPDALAALFREHGAEPFGARYADALARLSSSAVDGYLVGSADLVAHAADRWWVVDWKSNRLGADASAYTPEALEATMVEHHYGLQLHLYTLGLHRYLRSRLGAAYAYDTHVGGGVYAFLRGLGATPPKAAATPPDEAGRGGADAVLSEATPPNGGGGAGLFRHRPSAAIVDALDALLSADA